MEKRITAFLRDAAFAPGQGYERDAALMHDVAACLGRMGWGVTLLPETELRNAARDIDTPVIAMARHPQSLAALRHIQGRGLTVINSAQSLANSVRAVCIRRMQDTGIPMPQTVVLDAGCWTSASVAGLAPCWIKRGDICTQGEGDIVFCPDQACLQATLSDFAGRDASAIVISRHADGRLVKFYGVTGTTFFRAYDVSHALVSHPQLEAVCRRAAHAVGLEVWGGDCIIDADGNVWVIDLNDWPSFGCCRSQAAPVIAARINQLLCHE